MRKTFWLPISLALMAYLVLPLPGQGASLDSKIEKKRAQVEAKKDKEGVLTQDITRYSKRIRNLKGEITSIQSRQNRVQGTLDEKRAELQDVRDKLEQAKDRLVQLKLELKKADKALAYRLVELYKQDEPDALTVVLQSDGFTDLLERTDFLQRVADQDKAVIGRVRKLKAEAKEQTDLLAELEGRAQAAAEEIMARRDELAAAKNQLVGTQDELFDARGQRRAVLEKVRDDRSHLEGDLKALEKEQAKVQAKLQGSQGGAFDGPLKQGSGSLVWPVNGPVISPFGQRWGRLHAGVDIAVGTGTPIHAADGGTVVLSGWVGGYGNYTCIQHNSSLSTCYAHQSSFATSEGASVKKGQLIGYVGCTGHCFGPHLHFETRINGSPVDPMGYL